MGTKCPVKCKEKTSIKKEPASTLTDNGSLFKSNEECCSYIWCLVRDKTDLGKWGKSNKSDCTSSKVFCSENKQANTQNKNLLHNPQKSFTVESCQGRYTISTCNERQVSCWKMQVSCWKMRPPHFTANVSLLQLFEVLTASSKAK